ncbi:MAG TPA: class II aldolase/adducin family protein, partial [Longimicrobiales bacterium]|nr:class II aldolase/adducin family protein [Longimicrobiales bacterium]
MTSGLGGPDWRETLIEVGRDLYAHNLVTSHGGNLSVRRPAGGALITATGAMLGRLSGSRLVAVNARGEPLSSKAPAPSSNTDVHLAIYAAHLGALAVIHAHPVYAVARSLALRESAPEDEFAPINLEAQLILQAAVPVLTVDWDGAPNAVTEALHRCPIVLVRGHGSFAIGADLWQALNYTSVLEEAAQIAMLAG